MAIMANSQTAETSVLTHRPLNRAKREAATLLDGFASNSTEKSADIGTNRRRATLVEEGDKLTFLPNNQLTPQDIRTRLRYHNAVKSHVTELKRKLDKITSGDELKNGNSAEDVVQIKGLIEKLEDTPFFKDKPLEYAGEVDGFGTKDMLRARLSQASTKSRLWLREHRLAGIPILGAAFVAKMTVGLWLLSEFDKVFHSHATSGNPIPQGFSFPGLGSGSSKISNAVESPQVSSQGGQGYGGYNQPYQAYTPSAPPMPSWNGYGSGLY